MLSHSTILCSAEISLSLVGGSLVAVAVGDSAPVPAHVPLHVPSLSVVVAGVLSGVVVTGVVPLQHEH